MKKNVLIKSSGDTNNNDDVHQFAITMAQNSYVVMIVGVGGKLNQALSDAGFPIEFGSDGRNTDNWGYAQRKIYCDVCDEEVTRVQDLLTGTGITIIPCYLRIAEVISPINGDMLVRALYKGYDEIYLFTLADRLAKKKVELADIPKIKVIPI